MYCIQKNTFLARLYPCSTLLFLISLVQLTASIPPHVPTSGPNFVTWKLGNCGVAILKFMSNRLCSAAYVRHIASAVLECQQPHIPRRQIDVGNNSAGRRFPSPGGRVRRAQLPLAALRARDGGWKPSQQRPGVLGRPELPRSLRGQIRAAALIKRLPEVAQCRSCTCRRRWPPHLGSSSRPG